MKHVFIIGSRGLPAQYGGFETFVEELIRHQKSSSISYHVACLSDTSHHQHRNYLGADCFTINPPRLGPARVIAYDLLAIAYCLQLIRQQKIENPIFYLLGNTIGGFIGPVANLIHACGGTLLVNPDGLEWRRSKWSKPVQGYLKYAEKMMTKYADWLIADNRGIETYLQQRYPWSRTQCITYGTDASPTSLTAQSPLVQETFANWNIREKNYYLLVGRFVPENNYAVILREFMASKTSKDLVLVCNQEGSSYFKTLLQQTQFDKDSRIKFIGTVYEKELLKYLRENCRAYIHGHEVGGTNPSLLEALAQTNENLVLDVSFNRETAQDSVHYWTKRAGHLAALIDRIDQNKEARKLGEIAKSRVRHHYTWEKIVQEYEEFFLR